MAIHDAARSGRALMVTAQHDSLAVVGGGPKALMALAALDDALAARPATRPLDVDLYDPAAAGAGRVWDPQQPPHLLLNLDASKVDFRCESVRFSYTEWEQAHFPEAMQGQAFPPRARMGGYLAWVLDRLADSSRLNLRRRLCRVEEVIQAPHGWLLRTPESTRTHGEVLLATGHAGTIGPDHRHVMQDLETYARGGQVAVRGAALTGIDTVLSLTAGRGGRWTRLSDSDALTYVASGDEPAQITMVSRSGELLAPKPLQNTESMQRAVTALTSEWWERSDPDDAWWSVVISAAVAAAADAGIRVERDTLEEVLDCGREQDDPLTRWRSDLRRAEGEVDADAAWWLGRAWALGYADVVRSLERAPRHRETWARWRVRAARLERWAFGPPVDNVRRLLALHRAGILEIAGEAPVGAAVVDAVTTQAGVLKAEGGWREGERPLDPLWAGLLCEGHVQVRPGERGILTDPAARCLRSDGTAVAGLAAIGRPTEDPVIGHDTLSRTLHGDVRRWAEAMADSWSAARSDVLEYESMKAMIR